MKIQASTILVLFLIAGSAGAQFEYTAPGGPAEKPANRKLAFDLEVSRARYRLGPVLVQPWAALHDVAYVRTLFNTGQPLPSDLTATVGAGFRAYLRNGTKVTWSVEALPEYVWWEKQADRRRLDGRYRIGFHGFFNRLTVEATAGHSQQLRIVTPEIPVLTNARQNGGEIVTELELAPTLFTFGAGSFSSQTYLTNEFTDPLLTSLHLLDRRERLIQGGLRWQPRQELSVALGLEGSRVDFARTALPRSNSGTSPLIRFRYRLRLLGFEGDLASRSLSARQGSDFVPFHKTTGSATLQLGSSRLVGSLYASRNLNYAITSGYAYLQDDRLGLSLRGSLGRRFSARAFAETGSNDYTAFAAGVPHRRDDVSSFGGGFDFDLGRDVIIGFNALRSRFAPSAFGPGRTYTSAGLTFSFGGR